MSSLPKEQTSRKPLVINPIAADLRKAIPECKNPCGCDLVRAGAIIGKSQKADIVIINDSKFSSSDYDYSSKAVLVSRSFKEIASNDQLVGRNSINVPGNDFVVLKGKVASPYLNLVP